MPPLKIPAGGSRFDPSKLTVAEPAWAALLRYLEAPAERTRRNMVLKMLGYAPVKAKTCQTLINEALKLEYVQCVFTPPGGKGQRWYAAGKNHPTTPQAHYKR